MPYHKKWKKKKEIKKNTSLSQSNQIQRVHRGTLGGEHILRATVFGDASGGHPDPPDVALPADCFNIGPSPQMPVPTSKRSKKR